MSSSDLIIVGGGISGLSLLHFVRRANPDIRVTLLEAESDLGGTMRTDRVDGFSLDWGPNGFLDREPLTLQLCDELGLTDQLERANPNVQKRFILRGNRLREIPMSPPKFLTSDILSLRGRLRVLFEPFTGRNGNGGDQSIHDFACRHIGREAANYLVQSMVSGIYGGLADRLSLESCFPIMSRMEREHGSLVKAMFVRKREARSEKKTGGGPGGPAGWLTSFKGGLSRVVERLEELYSDHIVKGATVRRVSRVEDDTVVDLESGQSMISHEVVLAIPSYNAAEVVEEMSPLLSKKLAKIPYAPISVVCLGFRKDSISHPLNGFGFLVPRVENRSILGSIWTSSIFADRAPDGMVQFRTMVGGDGNHESIDLSDDDMVRSVMTDLDRILGITGSPILKRVYRWRRGIPQYVIGHRTTLDEIESELAKLGRIHIAGNAYHGIGVNDCVKRAKSVADAICERVSSR